MKMGSVLQTIEISIEIFRFKDLKVKKSKLYLRLPKMSSLRIFIG